MRRNSVIFIVLFFFPPTMLVENVSSLVIQFIKMISYNFFLKGPHSVSVIITAVIFKELFQIAGKRQNTRLFPPFTYFHTISNFLYATARRSAPLLKHCIMYLQHNTCPPERNKSTKSTWAFITGIKTYPTKRMHNTSLFACATMSPWELE